MKQDFFKYLPSEITINILSRLPVVTTVSCKCVCKSWLDLLETREFITSHLSQSVPGLAVFRDFSYGLDLWPKPYKFFEFIDNNDNVHHCSPVFNFNLPHHEHIHSSVNGLLLLSDTKTGPLNHFICNPITREYIELPPPHGSTYCEHHFKKGGFGFGLSKLSGQYKVVMVFHENCRHETMCQVYTLGTRSWRRVGPSVPLEYAYDTEGTFLNGNLHWQIRDLNDNSVWISCFDLETELFSLFSAPLFRGWDTALGALEENLVFCDELLSGETIIWLMNEYGDDKSWTKKFIINMNDCYGVLRGGVLCPVKVFKDGDILIAQFRASKLCYSNKPNTHEGRQNDVVELYEYDRICAVSYTPSFLPLKTFTPENVRPY